MNRYLFAAIALTINGYCSAAAIDLGVKKSVASNTEAVRSVLISQGYIVPYFSKLDGMVTAERRDAGLTSKEADCGTMFGIPYLKDGRTKTALEITFTSSDQAVSADVHITGTMYVGYGNPNKRLACSSTGVIEAELLPLIREAALSMPDEEPSPPTLITQKNTSTPEEMAAAAELAELNLNSSPKKPSDAVDIVDITMNHRELNYSDAVTMAIQYRNKTTKRIIGIVVRVTATNAFGKPVLSNLFEDEVVIEPGKLSSKDQYWHWKNNPYIQNEPYDLMAIPVQNDTIKTKANIIKVIFADGTKVEATSPGQKKTK